MSHIGKVESLFSKLQPLAVRRGVEGIFSWRESKNGKFSVRSLYCSYTRVSKNPFPWDMIWRSWAPMRVSFFVWEASWSRILSLDQLKRRGWNIPNRCYYLCKEEEETTNHLLLFCGKARMLWSLIYSLFGVQWVMHSSIRRNLLDWHGLFVG